MKHSGKGKTSKRKSLRPEPYKGPKKTKNLIWKTTWVFFNVKINISLEVMLKVIQNLKDAHSFMTV